MMSLPGMPNLLDQFQGAQFSIHFNAGDPACQFGKVLLACTCVTSHATYKKKKSGYGLNPYPLGLFDLRHPYPLSQKAREYSTLSSQRAD